MTAQNKDGEWGPYMATYDDGKPGSTTLRMGLIDDAPLEKFPIVLVTGITYEVIR